MFSQVFVCPRFCLGLCPGVPYPGISVWESLCPGASLCLGCLCPGGSLSGMGALCHGDPPYDKERAVRILLECILVFNTVTGSQHTDDNVNDDEDKQVMII